MYKLSVLADQLRPSLIGGGGFTVASIAPDPSHIGQWSQAIIAVVTVIAQIIHLFKKKPIKDVQ